MVNNFKMDMKQNVKVSTALSRLGTGYRGDLCEHGNKPPCSKELRMFWPNKQLSASEGKLRLREYAR
jgi:hypothetical protein